jgi:heme-degrading monooxygenase HmoA
MILEVAPLSVKIGKELEFEATFEIAGKIISSMPGYINHELRRCLEKKNEYLLLVQWQTLEDHEIGFRKSPEYLDWKALLHHFYEPFPTVLHYESISAVQCSTTKSFNPVMTLQAQKTNQN